MPALTPGRRPLRAWRGLLLAALLGAGLAGPGAVAQEAVPRGQPPVNEGEVGETTAPPASTIAGLPYQAGLHVTTVQQNLFPMRSLYQGPNSLPSGGQFAANETYTLMLGLRARPNLDLYTNPEVARGFSVNGGNGLGGYLNGHFTPPGAYIAQAYARWTVRAGRGNTDLPEGFDQIAQQAPAHRVVVTAGKVGINGFFDMNRYADSAWTQFINYSLYDSPSWDFPQNSRGLTRSVFVEWIHPRWVVRAGSAQVATTAGGPELSWDLGNNRGDVLEAEIQPRLLGRGREPAVARLLAFRNLAEMGNYRRAIRLASGTGEPPEIEETRREGASTYGFSLSAEQPLADEGETGLFLRAAWNNGESESWGFTECNRSASWGLQIAGARWRRADDRLGIAFAVNGLSAPHRRYLELGGLGFVLGDDGLNYGLEQIAEVYYACQLFRPLTVTLDYQYIRNPGYNQDRGPASGLALRAHVEY